MSTEYDRLKVQYDAMKAKEEARLLVAPVQRGYEDGYRAGFDAALASKAAAPEPTQTITEADIAAAREHIADVHNAEQMRSALSQLRPAVVCEMAARGLVPDFYGAPPVAVAAEPVARDDFDKLSADLTRAKNLLVRLHAKHPEVRAQIEGCTGPWFVWGVDRDADAAPASGAETIDMLTAALEMFVGDNTTHSLCRHEGMDPMGRGQPTAWPAFEAAMADPLFHECRGIMGTANTGQDMALRNALLHFQAKGGARAPEVADEPERFCNKCGYFGPDTQHQRPDGLGICGYLSRTTRAQPQADAAEPTKLTPVEILHAAGKHDAADFLEAATIKAAHAQPAPQALGADAAKDRRIAELEDVLRAAHDAIKACDRLPDGFGRGGKLYGWMADALAAAPTTGGQS